MLKPNTYRLRTVIYTFIVVSGLLTVLALGLIKTFSQEATAAPSTYLNFQARLKGSGGSLVPDGYYNIEFKLYDAVSAGNLLWTETRTGANTVRVANGYMSVSLGSVTAFPGTIDWSEEHWITMNIGGTGTPDWDGEMNPRLQLTAVPHAFHADKANTLTDGTNNYTADDFIKIAPGTSQGTSSSDAAVRLNQTGAGGILQLQSGGTDMLTLSNAGDMSLHGDLQVGSGTGDAQIHINSDSTAHILLGTTGSNATIEFDNVDDQLVIGVSGASLSMDYLGVTISHDLTVEQDTDLQGSLSVGGQVTIGTSDTTGTLLVLDTKTDSGDPTGTNGGMYYNADAGKFRCYEGGAWKDCISSGTGDVVNGGQNGTVTLGTNDANSLVLETNNQSALTIASGGASTFQNATNSTDALQVRKANGDSMIQVDTENGRIGFNIPGWDTLNYSLQLNSSADSSQDVASVFHSSLSGSANGQTGAFFNTAAPNSNSGEWRTYTGIFNQIGVSVSEDTGTLGYTALSSSANTWNSTGDVNVLTGVEAGAWAGNTGGVNQLIALKADRGTSTDTDVAISYGLLVNNPYGDGTISNNYGMYVQTQSAGDNNYGLYVQGASGGSGVNYALYVDSGESRFNGQVTIGTSDTTGTLLVLDTKTDSGDPTGVQGAMYYNADSHKFRCYEGATGSGAWVDCVGAGGGAGDIINGGNTDGLAVTIGTNDTYALNLETDGTTKWTVGTDGHFIPGVDDTYDIGSSTNRVRDLYLGPASLHIGTSGNEAIISYNTETSTLEASSDLNVNGVVTAQNITGDSVNIQSGGYVTFGGGTGSNGYGIRDNNGVLEVKDQGGTWLSLQSLLSSGAPGGGGGSGGSNSLIPKVESYTVKATTVYVETLDLTVPAGTENGDLLVAYVSQGTCNTYYNTNETYTPSGWTKVEYSYNSEGNCKIQIDVFTRIASGNTPGSTVGFDKESPEGVVGVGGSMVRISGASPVFPVHSTSARNGDSDEVSGYPAITTTLPNTLGITLMMADENLTSYPVSGWTNVAVFDGNAFRLDTRDQPASATYPAGDNNIEEYFAAVTLAIAPAEQSGFYAGQALLQDNFDDNSLDAAKWSTGTASGGSVTETSQQLRLGLGTSSSSEAYIYSDESYDMTGRWAGVQLVGETSSYNNYSLFQIDSGGTSLGWAFGGDGSLNAWVDGAGNVWTGTTGGSNAFVRVREASGVTYWETSPDGDSWSTRFALSNQLDMTEVIVMLYADNSASVAGSSYYAFDNFYLGTSDQHIAVNTSNYVVLQGGNNFGSHLTVGTLDNYNLSFMTGSQQVMVLDGASGAALFRNHTNSIAAMQVQNTSEVSVFTVDTANQRVYIGNPTADDVGALLVLDTKNTGGDPTGVNGAMYYNSSAGKFRCYEDGAWKDCIGTGNVGLAVASTAPSNTISGTTSETNFSGTGNNYVIPANSCTVGKTYRVTATGVQSFAGRTVGSEATMLKLKLGSTTLATTSWTWFGDNSFTDQMWKMEAQFTCTQAPSGTSAIEAQGTVNFFTAANNMITYSMTNTGTVSAATNTNQTLQVSAQIFNNADVGDSITMRQFIVEEMGP